MIKTFRHYAQRALTACFALSIASQSLHADIYEECYEPCRSSRCAETCYGEGINYRSLVVWGTTILTCTAIGAGIGYIIANNNRKGEKGPPGTPGTNGATFQLDAGNVLTIQFFMNALTTSSGDEIAVSFFVSKPDGTVSIQSATLPGAGPYVYNPVFDFPNPLFGSYLLGFEIENETSNFFTSPLTLSFVATPSRVGADVIAQQIPVAGSGPGVQSIITYVYGDDPVP